MARSKPKIGINSGQGCLKFRPTKQNWIDLASTYETETFEPSIRIQITKICAAYLHAREAELKSPSAAQLLDYVRKIKSIIDGLCQFSRGEITIKADNVVLSGDDDVRIAVIEMLSKHLRNSPISIRRANEYKVVIADGKTKISDNSALDGTKFVLTLDLIDQIASELEIAAIRVSQELEKYADDPALGFESGVAFENWLLEMQSWAKKNGLRYGPYRNETASPFSNFLFQLEKLFPKDFRSNVASPDAMSKRLTRAQKQLKR